MATLTLSRAFPFGGFVPSWLCRVEGVRPPATATPLQDDRVRRDFVQDVLTRSPDAFSSDLDVHAMMLFCPERF